MTWFCFEVWEIWTSSSEALKDLSGALGAGTANVFREKLSNSWMCVFATVESSQSGRVMIELVRILPPKSVIDICRLRWWNALKKCDGFVGPCDFKPTVVAPFYPVGDERALPSQMVKVASGIAAVPAYVRVVRISYGGLVLIVAAK